MFVEEKSCGVVYGEISTSRIVIRTQRAKKEQKRSKKSGPVGDRTLVRRLLQDLTSWMRTKHSTTELQAHNKKTFRNRIVKN